MSAAFDTLDHATLLHRLKHTFGLSGCVISWIHSYLSERSSHVKVDSSSSSRTPSPTRVLQGSVLGLLLFVLFISPISSVIQSSSELSMSNKNTTVSFHQYADDTQLHIGTNSSTLATQVATLESCTVRVNDWLSHNGIHLNPSKSEAIAFFNPRFKPLATLAESIQSISVAGSPIKLQSSIKSLGVHLDSKMSFWQACFSGMQGIILSHPRSSSHSIFTVPPTLLKQLPPQYLGCTPWLAANSFLAGTSLLNSGPAFSLFRIPCALC